MRNSEESADWDEFEWEKALRESDDYAARYFQLLRRFCDLPGGNELIAQKLGDDENALDCDYDCDDCDRRWTCEFAVTQDWITGENDDDEADEDDDEFSDEEGEGSEDLEESPIFYENDPVFVVLRQTAIGWCNVYAAMLPPEARITGLKILYHIGRSLANLAYCIGDGLGEQPDASIAFAKRSLAHLNRALGFLNQMITERPRLERLLKTLRGHLMKVREGQLEHLRRCRERLTSTGEVG